MLPDAADRWQRVAALIDAALECNPTDRARYLEQACGGDEALRAEIEALLAAAWAPSFLDSGAFVFAAPLFKAASGEDASTFNAGPAQPGLPYELERKLASGGMATIYLARDAKHDRRVAVKVLHAELTATLGADRFVQEIRVTARLQHPHILALLDSGVFGPEAGPLCGRPYYVMPYVEGESLRARLTRGPVAVSEAVRVLREVADALDYAHRHGVVHRDVKPENILLSHDHAMVADFGIAKAVFASRTPEATGEATSATASRRLTQLGSAVGTPAYMAPEQAARGERLDHRADLYAWGVVAYELLAGRHPFGDGRSPDELAAAHARETPRPLAEVAPAVPVALAEIVMRCLAKEPESRPASSAELIAVLDAAASGAGPSAQRRSGSSRRLHLRMIAAAGLLALLGAGVASTYRRSARQGAQQGVAPVVVTGTGDAALDVPAVQAAVDQGGAIVLRGHFSFAGTPTKPVAPLLASGWYPHAAEVLVAREASISGVRSADGEMTTIEGGTIPFYVEAPGQPVTIRGLRFVRPIAAAILVSAVRGLEIASCKIEGVVPFAGGGEGIAINTRGEIPMPTNPGKPDNISGHLLVARNDIDAVGGTAHAYTMGIVAFAAGQSPAAEVDLDVIGNTVRNTTESMINIRRVNGRVRVLGNRLSTSHEVANGGGDAVRLVNGGSFLMANNSVECKWPNSAGITVFSQFAEWPMENAVVEDNEVLMSPLPGTVPGDSSAGINVKGFARGVVIRRNTIRGRARSALAMYGFRGGLPTDTAFIDNRFDQFQPALADIFVGSGVSRKRIVGPGSVSDQND